MADPSRSWVAKWQRIDGYVKGIYATKVMGQLPEEVITSLEEEYRIRYIPYVYNETFGSQKRKGVPGVGMAILMCMLISFLQARWKCYRGGLNGPYCEGDKMMKPFGLGQPIIKQGAQVSNQRACELPLQCDTEIQVMILGDLVLNRSNCYHGRTSAYFHAAGLEDSALNKVA